MADFLGDVERLHKEVKNVVVAVSEGVRTADGRYAAESYQSGVVDTFGHRYLSGVGKYLENMVRHNIGCKVRSVELNVLQRAAAHVLSATDIDEARGVGQAAVRFALEGKTGFVAVIRRASQEPYEASYDWRPDRADRQRRAQRAARVDHPGAQRCDRGRCCATSSR